MNRIQTSAALWFLGGICFAIAGFLQAPVRPSMLVPAALFFVVGFRTAQSA